MPTTRRLRALDVLRGLTVAAMILVNCSGSDDVFPALDHAVWNGLTFADFVFPSFLFIVGVSAVLSLTARRARGDSALQILRRTLTRSAGLFALGVAINVVEYPGVDGFRILGVPQRIAVCYMATVLALQALESAGLATLCVGVLAAYWLILRGAWIAGRSVADYSPEHCVAVIFDRALLGGHRMPGKIDPEGALSTLGAFASTLLGAVVGLRLVDPKNARSAARSLIAVGVALVAVGWLWSTVLPINKHLWTGSFVLVTGGFSIAAAAALLAWLGENPPRPFAAAEALGRHALAAYVGTGFIYGILEFVHARLPNGADGNLKLWLNALLFETWLPSRIASLAFAASFVIATGLVASIIDRRAVRPTPS